MPTAFDKMRIAHFVLATSLLFAVTTAQPVTGIKGRQYIFCPCSPTKRGFRTEILEDIQSGIAKLDETMKELQREGVNSQTKTAKLVLLSQEEWQSCVDNYSLEECVNADTALRAQSACAPNCASFCEYDRGSWRNNKNGGFGPACTSNTTWSSKEPVITQGNFPPDEVTRTPTNPNPGPEKAPGSTIKTRPDAPKLPSGSAATPPSKSGNVTTPGPDGGDSSIPPTVDLFAPEPPPSPGSPGEGCIAAEYLRGYVLQHSEHLWRYVLCSGKFCATPNHALIVDGVWTSMKRLCATNEWECVGTMRYVNNLKVTANRRAVISERIIATPYDLRFPRWAVWVVQIAEIILREFLVRGVVLGMIIMGMRYGAFRRRQYTASKLL